MATLTPQVSDTRAGRLWSVTGKNGAVSIELISSREGSVFGPIVIHHPHHPSLAALTYPGRTPESCDVLDSGLCHPDMAFRAGAEVGEAWYAADRDDRVIWGQLESWYRSHLDKTA